MKATGVKSRFYNKQTYNISDNALKISYVDLQIMFHVFSYVENIITLRNLMIPLMKKTVAKLKYYINVFKGTYLRSLGASWCVRNCSMFAGDGKFFLFEMMLLVP